MTRVGVSLEWQCKSPLCDDLSGPLLLQMASGKYDDVSLARIPADVNEWRDHHRTARKRADRASRRGYVFDWVARHEYEDDVFAINTSATRRQGRPMTAGYLERPTFSPLPVYPCDRHAVRTYGVTAPDGALVAYLWLYRAGDLALVSQILGHADHLDREVMYLLWQGMLACESVIDSDGFVVYNRHDSGTDGLRFFKERVGLAETAVEWLP